MSLVELLDRVVELLALLPLNKQFCNLGAALLVLLSNLPHLPFASLCLRMQGFKRVLREFDSVLLLRQLRLPVPDLTLLVGYVAVVHAVVSTLILFRSADRVMNRLRGKFDADSVEATLKLNAEQKRSHMLPAVIELQSA